MPLLFFILLVILIAQIGFWDTLGAVLGAALMMVVFVLLIVGALAIGGIWAISRLRSPHYRD